MTRSRTVRTLVTRVTADGARRRPDELIVEEPMTIQLDGTVVNTTMRTPGHDFELAAGWCFTEGLLGSAEVTRVRYCADGSALATAFNVVTVETDGRAPTPRPRLTATSSSCGWCGSDQLDELVARLTPVTPVVAWDPALLAQLPRRVVDGQGLFDATGAVHAAAIFDRDGAPHVTREDVGRHNAVDKVIGRLLLDGSLGADSAATGRGLFVSGRASIEIVQKAWAAGCSALVAVSAPTALAVEAARRAGIALVAFVRDEHYNVYAPARP